MLILDEPFANLDPTTQMRLIRMLGEMQEQRRMTILISSHDLNHITDVCSRILLMEKGRIIKDLLKLVDAKFVIKSQKNKGTMVSILLPMQN